MKQLAFVIVLLSLATAPALAIGPDVGFGAHANFTVSNIPGPSIAGAAQLSDAYGMGIGGGAHLDVGLIGFGLRFSVDYMHYPVDQDKFRSYYEQIFGAAVSQLSIDGGGLTIVSATVNGKMPILPLPIVTPYLIGGGGLAWVTSDEATTSIAGVPGKTFPSVSQSGKWTASLGAGVDIKVGITIFAEVKYAWIFTDGENSTFVPITVGVTF